MNSTTKNISFDTQMVNSTVTRGMVDDLSNFGGMYGGYFVRKDLIKEPINNNIITIKNYNDDYYSITINDILYERFKKILKITKDEYLKKVFDQIEICENNRKDGVAMMESDLVDELTKSIDKEILKNIMAMSTKKFNTK